MTTDEHEVVAGELVTVEPAPAPITLFGTADPRLALERMADVAGALVDVIEKKRLYVMINGRKHITVEGWTTLGGMLGVVPVVIETRDNTSGDGIIARAEARTLDGRIVGAAEAECSRAEAKWKTRDPYAIRSMAQTRAISRALRAPLGQIIVLAGYEAAGAEEIPADESVPGPVPSSTASLPPAVQPTGEQGVRLRELIAQLSEHDPGTDWLARAAELAGAPWNKLTRAGVDGLIRQLEQIPADQGVGEEP